MKQTAESITIQISERVLRHAKRSAAQHRQQLEEILSAWLEKIINELPVEELPDEEVLALTGLQQTLSQKNRLSELLLRNREESLSTQEQQELDNLMRLYEYGLLRKSQALRIAVQRGLLAPLQP